MSYVDGFVAAVPTANRDTYVSYSRKSWPLWRDLGAHNMTECWGDDVPDGKVTDFRRAVQAKPDETVVFSWISWPDKATRDAAMKKMMDDPKLMGEFGEMPFDGKRMIYGGFSPVFHSEGK